MCLQSLGMQPGWLTGLPLTTREEECRVLIIVRSEAWSNDRKHEGCADMGCRVL
jgi:hypothetical protein